MKIHNPVNNKSEHGFTLIEIMITVLILGIGLLGLAGLQTKGLQYDNVAFMRSQAAILADDIVDRMRANINQTHNTATGYNIDFKETSVSSPDCVANTCSETSMVSYDLTAWKTALADVLPSGDGEITTVASVNSSAPAIDAVITVHWDETRSGVTGTNCPVTGIADLACFQIRVSM